VSPARGQRTYVNHAVVTDGTRCRVEEKGKVVLADAGRGMGGDDDEPTPSMLLRSALSSCMAIGVKLWAARADVPIDRVEVTLETDTDARGLLGLDERVPPGFTAISARIDLVSPAPPELVEQVVERSLRFSPLFDAIAHAQPVETLTRVSAAPELETSGGTDGR